MKGCILYIVAAAVGISGFAALLVGASSVLNRPDEDTVIQIGPPATQAQDAQEGSNLVCFPYKMDGLTAEHLVEYEGPFLEDGDDEPVSGMTAILLRNTATEEIAQVEVVLQGTAGKLTFFASNIPAGASVIVLERGRKSWEEDVYSECTARIHYAEQEVLPSDILQIEEVGMGNLSITNVSDRTIEDIWLFHKNYLQDVDIYVGGITYVTSIEILKPGQTLIVTPNHYAAGYSKLLKAEGSIKNSRTE